MSKEISNELNDKVKIDQYVNDKYLHYTMSTLIDRAIPYLNDGLKPVHRRILYAMSVMGIKAGQNYKKSARIVGDVIGKYHPHGDTAVYETMVRLSQDWVLRYPLIKGQGNFGSRDGDGAAAMRYTESSLTEFAEHILLSELKEGTSDFIPNYDGTLTETKLLSSRLNHLLLNGATGIAVGLATNIPSHNIRELSNATIAYINNKDITIEEIMEHLKGPDFASAGQIINSKKEIINIYKKGQGKIRVRAKWHVEKLARGQWQIVITELPPQISILKVLNTIDSIANPIIKKDKDGKAKTSAKTIQDKNFLNNILNRAKDESDKNNKLRLVLEPKSSRQDPEEFMEALIPRINLEDTFGVNMVAIGQDQRPRLKNIKEFIAEWVDYRVDMIKRRLTFHLEKTQYRILILNGRLKVYSELDKVIEIITKSDNPKEELIESFDLNEIQAEDILELKLRRLSKLEIGKLREELEKLLKKENELIKTLESERKLLNLMKKEIEADTVKFEDERRTLIKEEKTIVAKTEDTIIDEAVTIIFTEDGWITQRKGHNIEIDSISLKQGDSVKTTIELRSTEPVCFLSSSGRGYSIKTNEIPNGKNLAHINSLIELEGATIVDVFVGRESDKKLFTNSSGFGFISSASNLISKNKKGKHFMSLINDSVEIFKPIDIKEDLEKVNVITTDERLLSFPLNEMKELDKGKGVTIIKLVKDNKIKFISLSRINELNVLIKENPINLDMGKIDYYNGKRAQRGKIIKDCNGLL